MIIDKKREEMFFRCRMRKKKLDKKLNIIKAVLLIPVAFLLISEIVWIFMNMFSDVAALATGALFYGYDSKKAPFSSFLFIVGCVALFLVAVCITIFDTEWVKKHILKIYPTLTLIYIFFGTVFEDFQLFIVSILSIIAIPLGIYNNKLKDEEFAMSKLDGYPHFNILLMENRDTDIPKTTKTDFDEMTPDEKIMFERDGGRIN